MSQAQHIVVVDDEQPAREMVGDYLRMHGFSVSLCDGATVPLRGVPHRIEHRRGARGTVWVECGDDGANLLCVAGEAPHVARRLIDYLRREAKRDLERASLTYAAKLGVSIRRITVRRGRPFSMAVRV